MAEADWGGPYTVDNHAQARVRVGQHLVRYAESPPRGFMQPWFYKLRYSFANKYAGVRTEMDFLYRQTDLDLSKFRPEGRWTAAREATKMVLYFQNENDAVLFKLAVR